MALFSYHLVEINFLRALMGILYSPISKGTKGLVHSEYMTTMTLGSPILSTARVLIGQVAVFMQWEEETALNHYLENDHFGKVLSNGWHVRLSFTRQWGQYEGFKIPEYNKKVDSTNSPVVAVTIARMKPFSVPRFIYWGRPVEKLVRDHPGTTLALAAVKFPNTVSTFSIWKSEKEMKDMVQGHSTVEKPKRHVEAMKERERKDFHFEFTTLRFKPLAEFGTWKGRSNFIP